MFNEPIRFPGRVFIGDIQGKDGQKLCLKAELHQRFSNLCNPLANLLIPFGSAKSVPAVHGSLEMSSIKMDSLVWVTLLVILLNHSRACWSFLKLINPSSSYFRDHTTVLEPAQSLISSLRALSPAPPPLWHIQSQPNRSRYSSLQQDHKLP